MKKENIRKKILLLSSQIDPGNKQKKETLPTIKRNPVIPNIKHSRNSKLFLGSKETNSKTAILPSLPSVSTMNTPRKDSLSGTLSVSNQGNTLSHNAYSRQLSFTNSCISAAPSSGPSHRRVSFADQIGKKKLVEVHCYECPKIKYKIKDNPSLIKEEEDSLDLENVQFTKLYFMDRKPNPNKSLGEYNKKSRNERQQVNLSANPIPNTNKDYVSYKSLDVVPRTKLKNETAKFECSNCFIF
ncbi:MAG: hypothetical protein MJ252_17340 [archaeon]|nr:hypothetical protein [archaeon]